MGALWRRLPSRRQRGVHPPSPGVGLSIRRGHHAIAVDAVPVLDRDDGEARSTVAPEDSSASSR